jgi:hypothetical protein
VVGGNDTVGDRTKSLNEKEPLIALTGWEEDEEDEVLRGDFVL